MIGRAAYHDTDLLLRVDPDLFGEPAPLASTFELIEAYLPYVEARLGEGYRLADMTRHMLGLFHGKPGARRWRDRRATRQPRTIAPPPRASRDNRGCRASESRP
jgi:tRNA-dihydrouridine synthase A